jgi:hypothetical protein
MIYYKRSIVLVELIFSLVLFSIIAFISVDMTLKLYKKNKTDTNIIKSNLLLESTRLFLMKNNNLKYTSFKDKKLFYKTNLLLTDVSRYILTTNLGINHIDICINDDTICQKWDIK